MTPKQLERWKQTRQMGRTRYIWLYGVLAWGPSVGVAWSLAMAAFQGWDRLPILLPLALIGFPIGGYFFGMFTWRQAEAEYERSTRDTENEKRG